MDIASGIVGLASFALELTTILYKCISSVNDVPLEMERLTSQLQSLYSALESFGVFRESKAASELGFEPQDLLEKIPKQPQGM